jgi:hypothetical protein
MGSCQSVAVGGAVIGIYLTVCNLSTLYPPTPTKGRRNKRHDSKYQIRFEYVERARACVTGSRKGSHQRVGPTKYHRAPTLQGKCFVLSYEWQPIGHLQHACPLIPIFILDQSSGYQHLRNGTVRRTLINPTTPILKLR